MYLAAFAWGSELIQNLIDLIFIIDLILRFFVDKTKTDNYSTFEQLKPNEKFKNTIKNYFFGDFLMHAVPCLPLHYIHLPFD